MKKARVAVGSSPPMRAARPPWTACLPAAVGAHVMSYASMVDLAALYASAPSLSAFVAAHLADAHTVVHAPSANADADDEPWRGAAACGFTLVCRYARRLRNCTVRSDRLFALDEWRRVPSRDDDAIANDVLVADRTKEGALADAIGRLVRRNSATLCTLECDELLQSAAMLRALAACPDLRRLDVGWVLAFSSSTGLVGDFCALVRRCPRVVRFSIAAGFSRLYTAFADGRVYRAALTEWRLEHLQLHSLPCDFISVLPATLTWLDIGVGRGCTGRTHDRQWSDGLEELRRRLPALEYLRTLSVSDTSDCETYATDRRVRSPPWSLLGALQSVEFVCVRERPLQHQLLAPSVTNAAGLLMFRGATDVAGLVALLVGAPALTTLDHRLGCAAVTSADRSLLVAEIRRRDTSAAGGGARLEIAVIRDLVVDSALARAIRLSWSRLRRLGARVADDAASIRQIGRLVRCHADVLRECDLALNRGPTSDGGGDDDGAADRNVSVGRPSERVLERSELRVRLHGAWSADDVAALGLADFKNARH